MTQNGKVKNIYDLILTSTLFAAIVVVSLDHDGVAAPNAPPTRPVFGIEGPAVGARVGEGALRELLAQKVCFGRELRVEN